jgi:hypothetical protein
VDEDADPAPEVFDAESPLLAACWAAATAALLDATVPFDAAVVALVEWWVGTWLARLVPITDTSTAAPTANVVALRR